MKILLLYHSREREEPIYRMIEHRIKQESAEAVVKVGPASDSVKVCVEFVPDVILMMPIRDETTVTRMTTIKLLYSPKIVCLTTEGVENFDSENVIRMRIGDCEYSENLIDYFFYWGDLPTKIFREALSERHRITDRNRVGTCGYVMYEQRAVQEYLKGDVLAGRIKEHYDKFGKLILFVTGFYFFDDVITDRKGCSTFPDYTTEEEYNEHKERLLLLESINNEYGRLYTEDILQAAQKYPNKGFVVKLHPIEIAFLKRADKDYYGMLEECNNILMIREALPMGAIFPYTELLFHYGSTTGIEAYIYNVPSVLLNKVSDETFDEKYGYLFGNTYFYSTKTISVGDKEGIAECVKNAPNFMRNAEMEKYLEDLFDYRYGEEYAPTKIIADELLFGQAAQSITRKDKYVLSTLELDVMMFVRIFFYKKAFRELTRGKLSDFMRTVHDCCLLLPHMGYLFKDLFRQTQISFQQKSRD